jgi:thiamine-phosphate pyrophosphorylase
MQLCAITDRRRPGPSLLSLVEAWSSGGVHFIQLREKDLSPPDLLSLVHEVTGKIDHARTKLLVNVSALESAILALAAGADGVHLAGKPVPGMADRVRGCSRHGIVSVPCHSLEDIRIAVQQQVDLLLFSPVFEKVSGVPAPAQGLDGLRQACDAAQGIPVFALGGVTAANAADCVAAGATGIAAIRLFCGDDWRQL